MLQLFALRKPPRQRVSMLQPLIHPHLPRLPIARLTPRIRAPRQRLLHIDRHPRLQVHLPHLVPCPRVPHRAGRTLVRMACRPEGGVGGGTPRRPASAAFHIGGHERAGPGGGRLRTASTARVDAAWQGRCRAHPVVVFLGGQMPLCDHAAGVVEAGTLVLGEGQEQLSVVEPHVRA